ncbi:hypothetical protein FBEOM_11627 [Fusarium beomiforme]|uniref:Telomeric single stranded DNA binding POT1/Cdc13 domain-containing protein n=1 Tax=Fusarium beomiforme TaxID=44412 RepID=A0A9P5A981_9HYPO|nr:hypothetical protein FBEOM_11627 [Fusarium beomiforme]
MNNSQPTTSLLDQGEPISIAQLGPDVPDQEKRVILGTVTIIWPFSILNKSIAFLLAERDFRRRRENGQVRVRFHGAAAKAIADASLGAGDEVRVSLQGVKWEKNETQTQVAGSTLAWQLEFTNRMVLRIRRPEEQDMLLNIDTPVAEPETTANGQTDDTEEVNIVTSIPDQSTTPTPSSPEVTLPAKRNASTTSDPVEFASPAFLKRARVSYGALFEGDIDMFDDDVGRTKSKKRARFSLPANAWRYTSRSPSPEPVNVCEEVDDEESHTNGVLQPNGNTEDSIMGTPQRPTMVDQGSQTSYDDFTPMASVQVLAESRPPFGFTQTTPTPFTRTRSFEGGNSIVNQSLQLPGDSTTPHGMPNGADQDLLGQSPNLNTDLAFSFTPQAVLFPQGPGFFPGGNVQETVADSPSRVPGAVDYPAEFLETEPTHNSVEALTGLSTHEPQSSIVHQNPFITEPGFHSAFTTTTQPPQNPWTVAVSPQPRSGVASSDAENPVEILSSSPSREQSSREPSEDHRPSLSRENTDMNVTANASSESALEEPASEAEYYRDGGDEPGDDYDLRKYSRTHDDDDDIETSEEEPDMINNDPDTQTMNPEEDDADGDEDIVNREEYLDEETGTYEQRFDVEGEEYEGSEGEYYSDEDDYYDDDEGDTDTRPSAPLASQAPIVIDLLSDSEDGDETAPEPEPEPEPDTLMDAEVENEEETQVSETEEAEILPGLKMKEDVEVPGADKMSTEADNQRLSRFETNEEPQSLTREKAEQATNNGDTISEQMAPLGEDQVPISLAESSIKEKVEVAEAAVYTIKDGDISITGKGKSHVASSVSKDFSRAEESQRHGHEAEEESNSVEAETCDVDMGNAPPLLHDPKGHDTEDIAPAQSTKMNLLDETAVVSDEAVEAMDVDEAFRRPEEHTARPKTPGMEMVETVVDVSEEVYATSTEAPHETLTDIQEPTSQPEEIPYDSDRSPKVPEAELLSMENKGMTLTNQENNETQTFQDPQHSGSHETLVDRSPLLATRSTCPTTSVGDQAGNDEVKEANEQPGNGGQISTPSTQDPKVHTRQEDSINVSHDGALEQTPTPCDTQQVIDVEIVNTSSLVTHANQIAEDEGGPEDQIMAEALQQAPVRPKTHLSTDPALSPVTSQSRSPHQTALAEPSPVASPKDDEGTSEMVAAKSLRPRRHKSTKSLEDSDHGDPSLALITTTATSNTADRGSKHSSPATSGSKTRSKTHRDDPSIQLAGGSVQADTKNKGKRKATDDESVHSIDNNSPGSQRVLRPRNDHGDPSILLVKGSSPSIRQTRSQKTPDQKRETPRRETRSVSRSFQRQEESPNLSFVSLKSPSIAGSTATVPEEEDVKSLKMHLLKTLRTTLPDFLSLKMLSRNSIDKMTDILAVATQTPPHPHRPKHGPRDFMLTLCLTDPSTAPTQVRVAHIFRPHLTSLPEVESGDVILLRRVKVVSMKNRGFGVRSEDGSSWAVSKFNEQDALTQVKGPPIEVNPEEIEYAKGLRHWWSLQDDNTIGKIESASRKVTEAGKENTK